MEQDVCSKFGFLNNITIDTFAMELSCALPGVEQHPWPYPLDFNGTYKS